MTRETTVRTETLKLGNGQVLHVSRFREGGRDRITLVKGFEDTSPIPTSPDELLELPGSVTSDLVVALRSLDTPDG